MKARSNATPAQLTGWRAPRPKEAKVLSSRNAEVEAVWVNAVEGKPTYGGDLLVKPLIKGSEMTFLEISLRSTTSVATTVSGRVPESWSAVRWLKRTMGLSGRGRVWAAASRR